MNDLIVHKPKESAGDLDGAGVLSSGWNYFEDIASGFEQGPVDFTLDTVAFALDMLSTAVDPFGAVLSAGVGWALENIPFLRDLWDMLAGDPDAIAAVADSWRNISEHMTKCAEQMAQIVQSTTSWVGPAADQFRQAAAAYITAMNNLAQGASGISYLADAAGILVATLRGLAYQILATLLEWLIIEGLAALAASPVTLGASIGVFIEVLIVQAEFSGVRITMKVETTTIKVTRIVGRMDDLVPVLSKFANGGGDLAANLLKSLKDPLGAIVGGLNNPNAETV